MSHYDKKAAAKQLGVTEALITKYALLFVKYDYEFIMDALNNERTFTDKDLENFKQVIALKKIMKVEEAVKQIVKGNAVTVYNPVTPETMDNKLDAILNEVRFIKDENKAIKEELAAVKEELEERRKIEGDRDGQLMELIRSIQEVKKVQLETAATISTKNKKRWYEFWKK